MKTFARLATLAVIAASFTGCGRSLSPEMQGLAFRPDDVSNMRKVTNNQNARMISDDLARAFYLDHPSRLSPFPITYTSGMPR